MIAEFRKDEGVYTRFGFNNRLPTAGAEPIEIVGNRRAHEVGTCRLRRLRNVGEPLAGPFLRSREIDREHAIGVESVIGRAERCLLPDLVAHELGEPNSAFQPLSVAERTTWRER